MFIIFLFIQFENENIELCGFVCLKFDNVSIEKYLIFWNIDLEIDVFCIVEGLGFVEG